MISDSQIFIVVDIEADGPDVGLHSMLSIAAVATTETSEVSRFYRKLSVLPGATTFPQTMEFWGEFPEAWKEATTDPEPPETVMKDFYDWVQSFGREAIFVANPTSLDYVFTTWYLARFAPGNPFRSSNNSIRALDLKSYVAARYNFTFDEAKRTNWPPELTQGMPEHTHNALDDAAGFAVVLRNLIALGDR